MNYTKEIKPASGLEIVLTVALALALGVGGGMLIRGYMDQAERAADAQSEKADRQHEREATVAREAHLDDLLVTERKNHAAENRQRTTYWAAYSANAARVRNDLQARLER